MQPLIAPPPPIAINSRASMRTARSRVVSATICRRKLRRLSPRRSLTLTAFRLLVGYRSGQNLLSLPRTG
jgi:hypothetical protein